jgi:phosphoglycolate phosphatase
VNPLVVGFDLDMTLADSAAGIAATVQAALAEVGRTVRADQVWAYNGVPMEDTMAGLAPGLDPVALTVRYRELYPLVGVPLTTPLAGAGEAVDAVHARGGRVIVVSTKVESAVRLVLAQLGLVVDEVSGGLFAQAKAGALRAAGASVFVGDHPGDVAAARAAGAVAVAVATGPHPAAELAAAGADVVLSDLTEFPGWLHGYPPHAS